MVFVSPWVFHQRFTDSSQLFCGRTGELWAKHVIVSDWVLGFITFGKFHGSYFGFFYAQIKFFFSISLLPPLAMSLNTFFQDLLYHTGWYWKYHSSLVLVCRFGGKSSTLNRPCSNIVTVWHWYRVQYGDGISCFFFLCSFIYKHNERLVP